MLNNDEPLVLEFDRAEENIKKISTGLLFMVAGFCIGGVCFINSDLETNSGSDSGSAGIVSDTELACIKNIALFLFSVSISAVIYNFSGLNFSVNTDEAIRPLNFYYSHPITGPYRAYSAMNEIIDSNQPSQDS
tara:strand:- start:418 stop:819 length:402 start_codon:yes stop_codon:yes gene_type:complete